MFYGQCNDCGERWELGTVSTCKCPQPDEWVGLTDEEIMKTWKQVSKGESVVHMKDFARAIEANLRKLNK